MKSIFKNVVLITAFAIVTRLLGFLFRIFLSRTIGAEALGLYQIALSIFLVLLTVVSSGFTLIVSRMTAGLRVKNDKKSVADLVSSALCVGLILSVCLCLIVLIFKGVFRNLFSDETCINILIILLPSLIFSSVYSTFRGAMWGNDNYVGLCLSEFVEQIVKIAVCVLLLASGMTALESAKIVAWSFTISCFVSALFVLVLYFFYGGKLGRPTKVYQKIVRQASPITAVRVLGSFTQPLVALILPSRLIASGYTVSQAMSLYGVAIGMTFPLLFLPATLIGSLSTALVPDISMAMVKNDKNHIAKRVQSSLIFAVFVSFLIAPVFVSVGDKAGLFLYGDALSGTLLQYAAWIMIPMGMCNISSAILNSIGLEVKSFVNYVIGDALMFLILFFFTGVLGINALIFGMGLSVLVSAVLNIFMLNKKLGIRVEIWKDLFVFFLISLPTVAITSFVSALFGKIFPLWLDLLASSCVGVGVFVLLGIVFGEINISALLINVKEKFVSKRQKTDKKNKKTAIRE